MGPSSLAGGWTWAVGLTMVLALRAYYANMGTGDSLIQEPLPRCWDGERCSNP